MIIDGHAHSCGDFFDTQKMEEMMTDLGVDKIVLCPGQINREKNEKIYDLAQFAKHKDIMLTMNKVIRLVSRVKGTSKNLEERNAYVYDLVQRMPNKLLQFLWLNPSRVDVVEYAKDCYEKWDYHGLKLHQCSEYTSIDCKEVNDIADFASKIDVPLFIHLYSSKDIKAFIKLVDRHPQTNFIIAHLIGIEYFRAFKDRFNHVYFDISPIQLISLHRLIMAINIFGADHILLGSDTPYGIDNLQLNIERVKNLNISSEAKKLILGENMQKLLKV